MRNLMEATKRVLSENQQSIPISREMTQVLERIVPEVVQEIPDLEMMDVERVAREIGEMWQEGDLPQVDDLIDNTIIIELARLVKAKADA